MRRLMAALAAAALLAAGCGDTSAIRGGGKVGGDTVAVYAVVPLTGGRGAEGRDVVSGAKLALAEAGGRAGAFDVAFAALDDAAEGPGAAARRAIEDVQIIAAIGALSDRSARAAVPLFNEAGILLVAPAAGAAAFTQDPRLQPSGRPAFARLGPQSDEPLSPVLDAAGTAAFARAFRARFGRAATAQAKLGYDAMRAILRAIDVAGKRGNLRPAVLDAFFSAGPVRASGVRWRPGVSRGASTPEA